MAKQKVLVIIDMQKDFTSGVLGNAECMSVIPKIVDHVNSNGSQYDEIILTRDTHRDNYMETQEGKKLPVPHCILGSDGWQIVPEIMEAVENSKVPYSIIDKPTFGSMEIMEYAKTHLDVDYTFVGVCTGICVISNAMLAKATDPEAEINILANMCACVTPDSHKIALEAMKMCQMNIIED